MGVAMREDGGTVGVFSPKKVKDYKGCREKTCAGRPHIKANMLAQITK